MYIQRLLFLCFFSVLSSSVVGQEGFSDDWDLMQQKDEVSVYAKVVQCIDSANGLFYNNLIFKVKNRGENTVHVEWLPMKWLDGKPVQLRGNESSQRLYLDLGPGEEVVGECGRSELCEYQSFMDKPDVPVLTNYKVSDLKVHY